MADLRVGASPAQPGAVVIPGCRVVELRADRTPGEQAQGCYTRVLNELRRSDPPEWATSLDPLEQYALRVKRQGDIRRARAHALAAVRDARRAAAEHSHQGLATERFVDQAVPRHGAWSGEGCNPPY
jgi:hypothetical protein